MQDLYLDFLPLQLAIHEKAGNFVEPVLNLATDPNVKAQGYAFEQPLYDAARVGTHRSLTLIVLAGADVNAFDVAGNPPLLIAACQRVPRFVESLISAGADICLSNQLGEHTFDIAEELGNDVLIELHERASRQ